MRGTPEVAHREPAIHYHDGVFSGVLRAGAADGSAAAGPGDVPTRGDQKHRPGPLERAAYPHPLDDDLNATRMTPSSGGAANKPWRRAARPCPRPRLPAAPPFRPTRCCCRACSSPSAATGSTGPPTPRPTARRTTACWSTRPRTNTWLIHSPANGIGIKRCTDLVNWYDECLYTLGQRQWPWAQGRITAGHLLDLRRGSGHRQTPADLPRRHPPGPPRARPPR